MKILDLFCCDGGASVGIKRACDKYGIECIITGIDIRDKADYPFNYIKHDVIKLGAEYIRQYDFIWCSPPCQAYSLACVGSKLDYPDLVPFTKNLMYQAGCNIYCN